LNNEFCNWTKRWFLSRQHTDARYWCSNSVRPSVCHVPVSDDLAS